MCSGPSAGESSEGGIEDGYSDLTEVAAAFGHYAGVHFADGHFAFVASCSPTFAEVNSEMLQHAVAVHCDEEVRGSELCAVDCSDQRSCCYLC